MDDWRALLSHPVVGMVVLSALWWAVSFLVEGLLPRPLRWVRGWQRAQRLAATVRDNPHDRRARLALADLLVEQRRPGRVPTLLQPCLDAGDDDALLYYLLARAEAHAGETEAALSWLERLTERDATFRFHVALLERGRVLLRAGRAADAIDPLARFCERRPGTIEGKVLLSLAHDAQGNEEEAARRRDAAWQDYVDAPGFVRRRDRLWAWRARPSRPAGIVLGALVGLALVALLLGS